MIKFQPVRVDTASSDENGQLVFAADRLVAVLVQLSDQHEASSGQWYLEHGFGPLNGPTHLTFPTLDVVEHWIEMQLIVASNKRQLGKAG